jgi:hypothetical protein
MANAPVKIQSNQKVPMSVAKILTDDTRVPPSVVPLWVSSDPTVLNFDQVDDDGSRIFAVGLKPGTATLTVTVGILTKLFNFTVVAPPAPTAIALDVVVGLPQLRLPTGAPA